MIYSSIVDFYQKFYILKQRNFHFTYHMYVFFQRITLVTHVKSYLSVVHHTKMSCAVDIIKIL